MPERNMCKILQSARKIVEEIRFAGDTFKPGRKIDLKSPESIINLSYSNDLHISKNVTPYLFKSLVKVYKRLQIPVEAVNAFVFSSPEIQAECYAGSHTECIIRFSSALIDLLDEKEFEFVAGHELGHFLFDHGISRTMSKKQSLEFFMQQRAQEISVDRVGLLACNSLDVSIKALMKIVSGLTGHHLRFDVGSFLSQLRNQSDISLINDMSTHPSIIIRCRALLWFSLNDFFVNKTNKFSSEKLLKLDKLVQKDLDKFIDGPVKKQIEEAKNELAMWEIIYDIVKDNVFSKEEQIEFSGKFGEDTLERLKNFLKDIPPSEIQKVIYDRLQKTKEELVILGHSSIGTETASNIHENY